MARWTRWAQRRTALEAPASGNKLFPSRKLSSPRKRAPQRRPLPVITFLVVSGSLSFLLLNQRYWHAGHAGRSAERRWRHLRPGTNWFRPVRLVAAVANRARPGRNRPNFFFSDRAGSIFPVALTPAMDDSRHSQPLRCPCDWGVFRARSMGWSVATDTCRSEK